MLRPLPGVQKCDDEPVRLSSNAIQPVRHAAFAHSWKPSRHFLCHDYRRKAWNIPSLDALARKLVDAPQSTLVSNFCECLQMLALHLQERMWSVTSCRAPKVWNSISSLKSTFSPSMTLFWQQHNHSFMSQRWSKNSIKKIIPLPIFSEKHSAELFLKSPLQHLHLAITFLQSSMPSSCCPWLDATILYYLVTLKECYTLLTISNCNVVCILQTTPCIT